MSPTSGNNARRYNRDKYYSALKTGFKHMNPADAKKSFLLPPKAEEAIPAIYPTLEMDKAQKGQEA